MHQLIKQMHQIMSHPWEETFHLLQQASVELARLDGVP